MEIAILLLCVPATRIISCLNCSGSLLAFAIDIDRVEFTESTLGTDEIEEELDQ